MIGKTISHYKILEKLGEGGMGVVYKAEDTKLERTVAIKFLPQDLTRDEEAKKRFMHEAQAASALDHPNIGTIYEVDETEPAPREPGGQMFIVMAYYEGETLKAKIERGPQPIDAAIEIALQIAQGLAKAHGKEIVHRDIKPANIMMTTDNVVKIVDFGLAKLAGRTKLTKDDATLGTAAYMSPEQTQGAEVDHRSDIFGLGVVLYEMLTGQVPFKGDYEQAVIYSILNEDPEPITGLRTGVPMEFERIVNKAMEKDQELRYQSAVDLLADLKKLSKGMETSEAAPTEKTFSKKITKRKKLWRVAIPLGATLGLALAFLLLRPLFQEEPLVSSPKPIVVMPFENLTGDESFNYLKAAIPNLLITNLEQSKYLSVVTWERMRDILKIMGIDSVDVADIDKEAGFELCKLEGVNRIVLGSFTKAGDVFATDIKVLDVGNKKSLLSANSTGEGVASILKNQIDDLSKQAYRVVEIPSEEVEQKEFRVADVTTGSMEAYRYYLEGVKNARGWFQGPGIQNLERAIELDPAFAMAYYYLSGLYRQLQNTKAARAAMDKALSYSDKATEKEELYIKMEYARLVEGDLAKALSINEELTKKYPREKLAYYRLGAIYWDTSKPQEAIAAYHQALALDPNWGTVYLRLGYQYISMENYEKSEKAFQKYASLTPDNPNPFDSLGELYFMMGRLNDAIVNFELAKEIDDSWVYGLIQLGYIYAIKEDYAKALRQLDAYLSFGLIPETACIGYWNKGRLYFLLGRYADALSLFRKEITVADSGGVEDRKAQAHEMMSFVYAERGEFAKAENELQTCLKIRLRIGPESSLRWRLAHQCVSAFFDVKAGKLERAKEILKSVKDMLSEIDLKVPADFLGHRGKEIYSYWTTLLDGEIALAEGFFDNAIQKFRNVIPPKLRFIDGNYLYIYRLPVVRDGLARAYHATGDLDQAIAEYKRLITFDPKSKERFLIDPKHHYHLAKLYEEKGQPGLTIQEYEKFLEIWKDADKDLPELIDAKARCAKLKECRRNDRPNHIPL